jgi:hypothetical protein
VYNLLVCYRPARRIAIDHEMTAALWKLLKLTSNTSSSSSSTATASGADTGSEDLVLVQLISRICRCLALESEDEAIHKKLLQGRI